jgi:hypothetical protein
MDDLERFDTLTIAHRRIGGKLSLETLRKQADSGTIRCIRDPIGRRLLLREDVQALADRLATTRRSRRSHDARGSLR